MALRAATFQVKLSPFFSLLSPKYYFNLKFFVVLAPKNTFSRWNFSGFVFTVEWPRLTSPLKNGGRRKSAKIDETRIKRDSVKAFQLQDRSNMEVMCSEGSCCKTTAICRLRHLSKVIRTKCTPNYIKKNFNTPIWHSSVLIKAISKLIQELTQD